MISIINININRWIITIKFRHSNNMLYIIMIQINKSIIIYNQEMNRIKLMRTNSKIIIWIHLSQYIWEENKMMFIIMEIQIKILFKELELIIVLMDYLIKIKAKWKDLKKIWKSKYSSLIHLIRILLKINHLKISG
jgi:hypothetical protein